MRLRKVTQNDPVARLAVSVKSSTLTLMDQYRAHYLATYGEDIERSHLVEEILKEYITSDKAFINAKPVAASPVSKPPRTT